jgi:aspartyl-tRNA(Asn)/glutamyl-tRNA(Gln) amidotransferase subunit C
MSAPDFDVRYVATLARLNLTDEETRTFQGQLGDVLAYIDALKKVDVTGIEPTAHTSEVFNVFREDTVRPGLTSAEALGNAPRKANDLFVVTKVVE